MNDKRLIDALHLVIGVLMYRAGTARVEFDIEESERMMNYFCPGDETLNFDLHTDGIITMTATAEPKTA